MTDRVAICSICESEYDMASRRGRPGKISHCEACAEEYNDVERFSGNMIFANKTNATLQINTRRSLTNHINGATRLKNKGSNLGGNLHASARTSMHRSIGACRVTADSSPAKIK